MPKSVIWVSLSGVIVVLVGLGVWASLPNTTPQIAPTTEGPQPKAIVVNGTEYNFGVMQAGDTLEHTFVIRNEGDGPLRLEKGSTSCKCTLSELSNGEIQPGEEVEIQLSWEAKDESPNFRQTARIHTNDLSAGNLGQDEEVAGVIEFAIFGRIHQLVQAEPPQQLVATQLSAGKTHEVKFSVFSSAVDVFKITNVELLNDETAEFFEVSYSEKTVDIDSSQTAANGYEFTVQIKPGLPLGRFSQGFAITTDIPNAGVFEYAVKGSIVGELQILASGGDWNREVGMLTVGQVRSSLGATRHFTLIASGEHKAIEISQVEVSPKEMLKVSFDEPSDTKGARIFRFTIKIPPGTSPASYFGADGQGYGEITIHTTHPETPTLNMLVKFAVVDG